MTPELTFAAAPTSPTPRRLRDVSRRKRWAAALAVLTAGVILGSAYLMRDPTPRFLERRSALASAVESEVTTDRGYEIQVVRVAATSGVALDLTIRRYPGDDIRRLPLVVILGGHHTGRNAVRLLGDTRGTVVAALSYPFAGDPRPDALTFLRDIPKIRAAFLDTPPAIMLALDYLLKRPDVDTTRVEAVGVSLGAPFMCIAGALDSRFTRVWVLHGSGGSYAPLEQNIRRSIPAPLSAIAAGIANVIIAGPRLAPERWVTRIAPRPFMMVNAEGDERLPRSAVDELFRTAREPKEAIWMSGTHVHADTATVRRLADIVLERVRGDVSPR